MTRIYARHRWFLFIAFVTAFVMVFVLELRFSDALLQNLTTFFSITVGFYITCASIMYGSNYTGRLAREQDPELKQTKLQTLTCYIRRSSYSSLASLSATLSASLIWPTNQPAHKVQVEIGEFIFSLPIETLCYSAILGGVAVNIIFFALLLEIILAGLASEANVLASEQAPKNSNQFAANKVGRASASTKQSAS